MALRVWKGGTRVQEQVIASWDCLERGKGKESGQHRELYV